MSKIRVAVLDDHPAVIDGYRYRLMGESDIEIILAVYYAEELLSALETQPIDILLLDMQVTASRENSTMMNTLHLIPQITERFPHIAILIISQYEQRTMIGAMLEAGADGYVLKDDQEAYHDLGALVRIVTQGGMYLSARVRPFWPNSGDDGSPALSPRQLEALSLAASYPNERLPQLAKRMSIAPSTMRVILWDTYQRLGVNSRGAAISKARMVGILPPEGAGPVP